MRTSSLAAFALTAASSLHAQTSAGIADLSYATPVAGNWAYSATAGGSEATFSSTSGLAQLTIRCTRATRLVRISKSASAASPTLSVWTSSQAKSLPATFDTTASRLSAELAPFDPLLDSIAFSRGRFGVGTAGVAPLVVPPWSEIGRVIEDCRV